jgi:hypothetical protein
VTTDHIVILCDGFALGFDACLLAVFAGRIWDDYQDRRVIRRHTWDLDARQARLDALVGGEQE